MNTNKQTGDTTMNESYKDKFNATMKQFGIDSLDDLKSDEEKKKFFKAVDKSHKAANESVAEELMAIAEETINEIEEGYDTGNTRPRDSRGNRLPLPMKPSIPKPSMDYVGKLTSQMKKEMMKEMDKMPEMKMLKAETDPTKVEMMKKEMMKEMMKEMAEMSEMSETMKKEMMKEMSKKMNEYGSMNAMKEGLTAGQKKLPPALQKAIAAKSDKKETVSPAQQAAIAISKKEKEKNEDMSSIAKKVGGAAKTAYQNVMKRGVKVTYSGPGKKVKVGTYDNRPPKGSGQRAKPLMQSQEELEEKHVPDHQETAVNAMAMNAMRKETARKEMMVKAMKMPIRAMKTGDDDMTPDALKLNAMIKDPHKSREEDPKKDLNATYMTSDVRADVKNGGGTDMSKVQDAPKMMAAMKKISAMYKTEKYHDTKPGSLNDTLAQMHLDEHRTVSIKVQEFSALVETYLAKGGVLNNLTAGIQEVELNKTLKLREAREFITTYNRHFMTNYRAEEFIKDSVEEGGPGSGPQKGGSLKNFTKDSIKKHQAKMSITPAMIKRTKLKDFMDPKKEKKSAFHAKVDAQNKMNLKLYGHENGVDAGGNPRNKDYQ